MSWLDDVMDSTSEAESPKSFFYWSALAAVSAVVKNRVYLNKFFYKLYPNVYILLIAKSGMRKGIPVNMARRLVDAVNNTRVISGRNSIQGVVRDLSLAVTKPGGGAPIIDSCGFLVSGELSTFLIDDPDALTILTDLYDGHYNPEWKNTLKGSGVETLKNINLTLLGASNMVHFKEFLPSNAVGGGFIARSLIVHEDKRTVVNPLTERPTKDYNVEALAVHLREIAKLEGEFQYSPEGKEVYEEWYRTYATKDLSHDKTGISERIHDHILKVAMLLSLSKSTDLILSAEDINEAIDKCQMFTANVTRVTAGSGKGNMSHQMTLVLQDLLSKPPEYKNYRTRMLRKFYGEFDVYEFDRIIETLHQANAVVSVRVKGDVEYRLTDKIIQEYTARKQ